ncbi:hypothetical protein [Klebsiella quasipneumoniae]|uniref:hypothetical protein n=1 Tax=Klebsiella quasipneumoniae TaxID=1463165 RepID=UPI0018A27C85|nr:hypothetical protein [Klebsiella quasipneumoniae]MBF7753199.1 hypothetical protein [Klebsiella quasipneumoniae]MBF7779823.1 hypothetical protein [Klebsiella quasipneumoniae]HCA6537438.1 hypothetical protein [Klebsiella quasipneumoniae]HCA6916263.1 hypothetical protein [Klebsiella quasipneumoniae]HCD1996426.1 hypothetical protein [Klebsiella quasipneumoniae]
MIFIGEYLSSPFRYQQDLSAEIMPCFRTAKPALKHIACALASKNDSPVPGGTGHFYSPSLPRPRQTCSDGLFQAGMEDAIPGETTQVKMP